MKPFFFSRLRAQCAQLQARLELTTLRRTWAEIKSWMLYWQSHPGAPWNIFDLKIKASGAPEWLRRLGTSAFGSQSPGIEPHIGLPAQRGVCLSLHLCALLRVCSLSLISVLIFLKILFFFNFRLTKLREATEAAPRHSASPLSASSPDQHVCTGTSTLAKPIVNFGARSPCCTFYSFGQMHNTYPPSLLYLVAWLPKSF